jgi:ABC-type amino acid transport substrate-binding protein
MATMPAGAKAPLRHKGQLRVCALITGMPYLSETSNAELSGGTGKVRGFDVDVLGLVAKRMRAAPLFVKLSPTLVVNGAGLRSGACDVVAGLSDWPGFKETFTTTRPYERRAFAILTKKGGPASLAALAGKRVGVMGTGGGDDTTRDYVAYLRKYNTAHGGRINLVPQTDENAESAMLRAGQLDAVVTDDGQAAYDVKKQPGLSVAGTFGGGYGMVFGVRKGDSALAKQIDAALADAGDNGQYATAYWNWFARRPAWTPGH